MFRKLFAHNHLFLLLLSVAWLFAASAAYAQGTAFTYQGRLTEDGSPSDGTYDMQFMLFDTPDLGTGVQQAPPFIIPDVSVTNGVFTVQLDFGAVVFNGAARYLEIGMRPAGSPDPYTLLGPRQSVASTPYTIRSLSAATADTAVNATTATNATTAATAATATNASQLGGLTASQFIQNKTSQQASANFNISGAGTVGGTLSASVVNAATQYNIAGTRVLSVAGGNNTFVGAGAGTNNTASNNSFFGTQAGASNTTGFSNSFFGRFTGGANTTGGGNAFFGASTGLANPTGFSNSFFGASAGLSTTTGGNNSFFGFSAGQDNTIGCCNAFFGTIAGQKNTVGGSNTFFGFNAGPNNTAGSGNTFVGKEAGQSNITENNNTFIGYLSNGAAGITNATAIGANAFVNQSNSLVLGSGTNVGIGTSAPQDRLHVLGIIRVSTLGAAGSTQLCRNASNQIAGCSSSLRYKEHLAPFAAGLELINRLQPITFNWKQSGERDLGLGAEDVAKAEPLLVTRNERGEVEGVKYDRITVALINAVKQQQSQIESLKKIVCMDHPNAEICK